MSLSKVRQSWGMSCAHCTITNTSSIQAGIQPPLPVTKSSAADFNDGGCCAAHLHVNKDHIMISDVRLRKAHGSLCHDMKGFSSIHVQKHWSDFIWRGANKINTLQCDTTVMQHREKTSASETMTVASWCFENNPSSPHCQSQNIVSSYNQSAS